jgi:glycosyltransferase involved in cell wall biosynthesis
MGQTPERTPRISVVIPTRNRLPLLRHCLRSLERQDAPTQEHEIIVVDDGSQDGTAEFLSQWHPTCSATALHLPQPRGRSGARNHGLAAASGEVVIFLDGDVIAPPTLISTHRRHHAAGGPRTVVSGYPWCWRTLYTWAFHDFTTAQHADMRRFAAQRGVRPPQLLDPQLLDDWEGFIQWAGGPLAAPGTPARAAEPDAAPFLWFITVDVSAPRAALVGAGGFSERFRGHGLEDWELGYRLWRRGARFVSDPGGGVFHQAHPPRERSRSDYLHNYAVFLDLHPDAEIGLMTVYPAAGGMDRYGAWCRVLQRLRRVAPTVASALDEVLVDYGRAWVAAGGQTPPRPRRWIEWTSRWGADRVHRIVREQTAVLADPLARRGVALLQRLTGLSQQ